MDLEIAPSSSGRYWRREGSFTSRSLLGHSRMPVGTWLGHDLFLAVSLNLGLCAVSILAMCFALLPDGYLCLALYVVQAGCLLGVWWGECPGVQREIRAWCWLALAFPTHFWVAQPLPAA